MIQVKKENKDLFYLDVYVPWKKHGLARFCRLLVRFYYFNIKQNEWYSLVTQNYLYSGKDCVYWHQNDNEKCTNNNNTNTNASTSTSASNETNTKNEEKENAKLEAQTVLFEHLLANIHDYQSYKQSQRLLQDIQIQIVRVYDTYSSLATNLKEIGDILRLILLKYSFGVQNYRSWDGIQLFRIIKICQNYDIIKRVNNYKKSGLSTKEVSILRDKSKIGEMVSRIYDTFVFDFKQISDVCKTPTLDYTAFKHIIFQRNSSRQQRRQMSRLAQLIRCNQIINWLNRNYKSQLQHVTDNDPDYSVMQQFIQQVIEAFHLEIPLNNQNKDSNQCEDDKKEEEKDVKNVKLDERRLELIKSVKLLKTFKGNNEHLIQFLMQYNIRTNLTNDIIDSALQCLLETENKLVRSRQEKIGNNCANDYDDNYDYNNNSGQFSEVSLDTLLVISSYLETKDTIELGCCNRSMYITTQNRSFFKHRAELDQLVLTPMAVVTMASNQRGADLFRFSQCQTLSIQFTSMRNCSLSDDCMMNLLIKQSKSMLYNTNWLEILVSNSKKVILTSADHASKSGNCFSSHFFQQFVQLQK